MADNPESISWSARKVPPIVIFYVAGVFFGLILIAFFVFHSMTAVKALAMTAVGAMVPLVPTVLQKVEYRLADRVLEKRPLGDDKPPEFTGVFVADELSHIVPVNHGFKFYKPLYESNPLRRFWKLHVSDQYSGEVHVEKADQEKVFAVLRGRGVSVR